jgi:hypothetical protein
MWDLQRSSVASSNIEQDQDHPGIITLGGAMIIRMVRIRAGTPHMQRLVRRATAGAIGLAGLFWTALSGSLATAQTSPFAMVACDVEGPAIVATVAIPRTVLADGKTLRAGTYRIRVTDQFVSPATGQSASAERWVEFLKGDAVAGREAASVIPAEDIASVAKGPKPRGRSARVDVLKGEDYLRVWINLETEHDVVNLPIVR